MIIQNMISAKQRLILLAFLLHSGFCVAETSQQQPADLTIASIETVGNVTISRAKILTTIRARMGEVFDKDIADEDIKRLAKIEGVEYTYYNTETVEDGIKLTYIVVEKNLVRRII